MKISIEMDCMTLVMERMDDAEVWKATVTSTLNPDLPPQTLEVAMDDNQAAATAALACGVNLPENDPTEQALYAMTKGVWDTMPNFDLRPIP